LQVRQHPEHGTKDTNSIIFEITRRKTPQTRIVKASENESNWKHLIDRLLLYWQYSTGMFHPKQCFAHHDRSISKHKTVLVSYMYNTSLQLNLTPFRSISTIACYVNTLQLSWQACESLKSSHILVRNHSNDYTPICDWHVIMYNH